MHYVIIGNGVAGINAAGSVRMRDSGAKITIISSESDHFFSRTALMYVFCGQMSAEDVEPYERDLYARKNYERVRGRVASVDSGAKNLTMTSGEVVSFDSLLIASGSVPFMVDYPGIDLDGVGNFVTWQNLEWLTGKAKTARNAIIVGGGLIGIESLEILHLAGIKTTMVVREDSFWPIAFSKAEGEMITEHVRSHGTEMLLATETAEIVGENGRVAALKTKDGQTLDADLIVFAIGVKPQTEFLKNSGIELSDRGGIIVDEKLATNVPDIWAAGDCTSVVWFNGVRRPEQLWYTGRDQGKVAGFNMSATDSERKDYKRKTFYNSAKFFDIEYTTAGYVNFNFDGERDWYQCDLAKETSQRITYMPDGSVIGFNMLGSRWDHRPLVKWVEEKRDIKWVLEHLHEACFDEEFAPKFKVTEPAPALT
ncbi:FAD-dependent oxidoreductase [bacterium AH-315-J21]|nr:FAD-dependent oxidoreductase [bacterium AH-315-J21]